jgi:hypothetical protein
VQINSENPEHSTPNIKKAIKDFLFQESEGYVFRFKYKDISPEEAIIMVKEYIIANPEMKDQIKGFVYNGSSKITQGYFKTKHISELNEIVKDLKNLSKVEITSYKISGQSFKLFIKTLKDKEHLKEVVLTGNSRLPQHVKEYALKLFEKNKLTTLNLGNVIGEKLVGAIESKVEENASAVIRDVNEESSINNFSNEQINKYLHRGENGEFKFLFYGKEISPINAINLAKQFISDNPDYKPLVKSFIYIGNNNVSRNYFTKETVKSMKGLPEFLPYLENVSITNHKFGFEGLKSLTMILDKLNHLKEITVKGRNFPAKHNDKIKDLVLKFIEEHPQIRKLDLGSSVDIATKNNIDSALGKNIPMDAIVLSSDDMDVEMDVDNDDIINAPIEIHENIDTQASYSYYNKNEIESAEALTSLSLLGAPAAE